MTVHELKCWPEYMDALLDGSKTFEIRRDDRGFAVGDTLRLTEYHPDTETYGLRVACVVVTFLTRLSAWGIDSDAVVMAIEPVDVPDLYRDCFCGRHTLPASSFPFVYEPHRALRVSHAPDGCGSVPTNNVPQTDLNPEAGVKAKGADALTDGPDVAESAHGEHPCRRCGALIADPLNLLDGYCKLCFIGTYPTRERQQHAIGDALDTLIEENPS